MKKKVILAVVLVLAVVALGVWGVVALSQKRRDGGETKIITTNYIGYDFARAVLGDEAEVRMLLKPGAEMHNFEPTPQDVIAMKEAGLLIYNGGESEEWVRDLLDSNAVSANKTLRMMDVVELKEEETVEGMEDGEKAEEGGVEHEHGKNERANSDGGDEVEYDEHIWTSPKNAIKIVGRVRDRLAELEPERSEELKANAEKYIARLAELDREFREVVAGGAKKELIFGDRFPFRYFVDEYGLKYYAAFPGCAEQTEASSNTVAFLVNKVKQDGIKAVLKIEMSSGNLAHTIADETGAEVLELAAGHNISAEDFGRGVAYVDILERNVEVLKKTLAE